MQVGSAASVMVRVRQQPKRATNQRLSAAVLGREDGSVVRLTLRDLDDNEYVRTLELDLAFWPTRVFAYTDDGWAVE